MVVSSDRFEGYRSAMQEAGIEPRPDWYHIEASKLKDDGYRVMSMLMGTPERPTALVVMDDLVAFGILSSLSELGYNVPQDMAIFGFNNNPMSPVSSPPVSSVDIGVYQLGYTAAQALVGALKGQPQERRRTIVPHRLIARESSMHWISPKS